MSRGPATISSRFVGRLAPGSQRSRVARQRWAVAKRTSSKLRTHTKGVPSLRLSCVSGSVVELPNAKRSQKKMDVSKTTASTLGRLPAIRQMGCRAFWPRDRYTTGNQPDPKRIDIFRFRQTTFSTKERRGAFPCRPGHIA